MTPIQSWLSKAIDKVTGINSDVEKALAPTEIKKNITQAAPVSRAVENTTTSTLSTEGKPLQNIASPDLPLNVNIKEMKELMNKQVEQLSSIPQGNSELLSQMKENNSLLKQLVNATV